MPEGLIYAIAIFLGLLAANIIILILFRRRDTLRRGDANPDPNRANIIKTELDLRRAEAGMDEYERQVILDMLRDQLKYSQEDYSELQGAVKELTTRFMIFEGKFENQGVTVGNRIDKISNRLDNFLMLLTKILENTGK